MVFTAPADGDFAGRDLSVRYCRIIYRDGSQHAIGDEMTRMLQSMKHRGPDSTGYALYGTPENGNLIMRYKLADANTPRDFDFEARLRKPPYGRRVAARRARRPNRRGRGGDAVRAFRVSFEYDGDLKHLADFVEDILDAEVLAGRHRDRQGSRRRGDGLRPAWAFRLHRDPRDRTRPHGDRVGGRHRGRASVLGVPLFDVAVAQRPAHERFMRRRRLERACSPLHVQCRLEITAGFTRAGDVERRIAPGGDGQVPGRFRRRLHLHRGDEGRAGGREGRFAAKPPSSTSRTTSARSRPRRSRSARSSTTNTPTTRTSAKCSSGSDDPDHVRRAGARRTVHGNPEDLGDRRRDGALRRELTDYSADQPLPPLAPL